MDISSFPADGSIKLGASGQTGTGASDWAKYQKALLEANGHPGKGGGV